MSTARDCCLGSGLSFRDGGTCRQCIGKQFLMAYNDDLREDGTDMLYEAIHKPIVTLSVLCRVSVLYA